MSLARMSRCVTWFYQHRYHTACYIEDDSKAGVVGNSVRGDMSRHCAQLWGANPGDMGTCRELSQWKRLSPSSVRGRCYV